MRGLDKVKEKQMGLNSTEGLVRQKGTVSGGAVPSVVPISIQALWKGRGWKP